MSCYNEFMTCCYEPHGQLRSSPNKETVGHVQYTHTHKLNQFHLLCLCKPNSNWFDPYERLPESEQCLRVKAYKSHQSDLGVLPNDSCIPCGCHKQRSYQARYCCMILMLQMDCLGLFVLGVIWHDISMAEHHNDSPPEINTATILSHQLGTTTNETHCVIPNPKN